MAQQHRLELGRRHLVALVLDQLLEPVDDEDEPSSSTQPMSPVCSQPSASIVAAVASGSLEIALHHLRAANPELARLFAPKGTHRSPNRRSCLGIRGANRPIFPSTFRTE